MPVFASRWAWLIATSLTLACLLSTAPTRAQDRKWAVSLGGGSGVALGSGQPGVLVAHSPAFVDLAVRTWLTTMPELRLGGSLRTEIDGRVGVGIVPRAEIVRTVGDVAVRFGVGLPIYFAPYTLVGVEASALMRLILVDMVGFVGGVLIDAFFGGSDLPQGSALFMINGMVGIELLF